MHTPMDLPAVMTAETALRSQAQLLHSMQALPAGQAVVLNASGVQTFDSAGLALLLACRRAALAQGRQLTVVQWPASLQALAQMYGILPLLDPHAALPLDEPLQVPTPA